MQQLPSFSDGLSAAHKSRSVTHDLLKKKSFNYCLLCFWWQLYVSVSIDKDTGAIINLQPGWVFVLSGCLPACPPLPSWDVRAWRGIRLPMLQLRNSQMAKLQHNTQTCTWPDWGTDVLLRCLVTLSGTLLPFLDLSDSRCQKKSWLSAQDKSDINYTSFQFTHVHGNWEERFAIKQTCKLADIITRFCNEYKSFPYIQNEDGKIAFCWT